MHICGHLCHHPLGVYVPGDVRAVVDDKDQFACSMCLLGENDAVKKRPELTIKYSHLIKIS